MPTDRRADRHEAAASGRSTLTGGCRVLRTDQRQDQIAVGRGAVRRRGRRHLRDQRRLLPGSTNFGNTTYDDNGADRAAAAAAC